MYTCSIHTRPLAAMEEKKCFLFLNIFPFFGQSAFVFKHIRYNIYTHIGHLEDTLTYSVFTKTKSLLRK